MTWMLKLYPREWRRRYGAEVEEIVSSQPQTLQLAIDLLGGAVDAHVKPQAFARRMESAGDAETAGDDMVHRLTGCCAQEELTRRESQIAAVWAIGVSLVLAAALMLVDNETFKTVAIVMSPGLWMIATQHFLMRGHSVRARVALIGGPLLLLFAIGMTASYIVQMN